MYKVMLHKNGKIVSPYQNMEYKVGEWVEVDIDMDKNKDCATGLYATDIDGLPYAWRNLPNYVVYEVEVSGRSVEYDQFKRRYEKMRLVREVSKEELKELALAWEDKVGYKLSEVLFPVNPFEIEAGEVTDEVLDLLKEWDSVRASMWDSVRASVRASVGASVWASVWASMWDSMWDSVRASVWASMWDSVGAYISSFFPHIKKWKYIDHQEGKNPFQSCSDLWCMGFVPSYDGNKWRLHTKNGIVWEGKYNGSEVL